MISNSYPKHSIYINRNVVVSVPLSSEGFAKIPRCGFSDGGGDNRHKKKFLFSEKERDDLLREIRRDAERIRNRNAKQS